VWPSAELVEQVRLTRSQLGATGNVHFSMTALMPRSVAPPTISLSPVTVPLPAFPSLGIGLDGDAGGGPVAAAPPDAPPTPSAAPVIEQSSHSAVPVMLGERLRADVYADPALVPASPWLSRSAPARPKVEVVRDSATGGVSLRLGPGDQRVVRLWTLRTRTDSGWTAAVLPEAQRLHALTASASETAPEEVVVTAVDRYGNESAAVVVRPGAVVEARR
jgi:hypothetical protein